MSRRVQNTDTHLWSEPAPALAEVTLAGGWRHFRDTTEVAATPLIPGAGSTVQWIMVDGERYDYSASEPSHGGKVQDGAGTWWVKAGSFALGVLSAKRHGVVYGGGDQSAKLQDLCDMSEAEGGKVILIDPDDDERINVENSFYLWDGCGPLLGGGYKSWIHNTNADPVTSGDVFWTNGVLEIETMRGHVPSGSQDGAHLEASYEVQNISMGDHSFTLVTAGDAANFAVGDLVAIMDPNLVGATNFERAACITEVTGVSGGVITVMHPFTDFYTDDGGSPLVRVSARVLNTGALTPTLPGCPPGRTVAIARNPIVKGLRLSQAVTYYGQVMQIAAYGGTFKDLWVQGAQAIGGNPLPFTLFQNVHAEASYRAFECAYLSNNMIMQSCSAARKATGLGGGPDASPGSQSLVAFTETGGDRIVRDLRVHNYGFVGDSGQAAVDLSVPRTHLIGGMVVGSTGAGISASGTDPATDDRSRGSHIEAVDVMGFETDGIVITSNHCRVIGNRIIGTPAGRAAIRVKDLVSACELHDNHMRQADGSYAAQDRIEHSEFGGPLGDGSGIIASRNTGYATKTPDKSFGNPLYTATNATHGTEGLIHSFALPANTTLRKQRFVVQINGAMSGSAGNRRFRLCWGGLSNPLTGFMEVLAGGGTGAWRLVAELQKNNNGLVKAAIALYVNGSTPIILQGVSSIDTTLNAHDIGLSLQVLNAADSITVNDINIQSMNDQFHY